MSADLIEWNGKDIYSSTFFYRSIVIAKVLLCYNTRKTAHGIRLYFVSFPPHLISPFFFFLKQSDETFENHLLTKHLSSFALATFLLSHL